MTSVTITCRITWHEQCEWVKNNCKNYTDLTNWGLWQLGLDDIIFLMEDKDAVWFNLVW